LIDELWGERPPATATKTLQVNISRLRKTLDRSAAEGRSELLLTRERGYELRVDPERVDARRFERLIIEGRRQLAAQRPERALSLLDQALSLWRGPPLAEFAYEQFAREEIARLDELRIGALEELIDAKLALGRHGEVVGELERLIREHPYRERLRAQLMLALYRCDRQADALQAYQDARRTLVEELGIEPGQRLRELERAVLDQDQALAIPHRTDAAAPGDSAGVPAAAVFVGREPELAELVAGLDDAYAGHGRLVILVGEPGIGKSRLAEELGLQARARGARVLVGRCWEAGGAPAYWPWVQSLRSYLRDADTDALVKRLGSEAVEIAPILPELGEVIPWAPDGAPATSEGARFRLFHAVAELLRNASEERPIVLVLDDLHAADTPSLLLLRFLARELGSMRVLLLAALRDVDPIPDEPLTEMLAAVTREPTTRRISLTGLSEHDVAAYLELTAAQIASDEFAAELHAETEGNPLFVAETVRLISLEGLRSQAGGEVRLVIPQSVRDVISRRLAHLSSECHALLVLASVLGREFTLDSLVDAGGPPEDELLELLDEAMTARVVSEFPGVTGRLRFAHVLVRDTLYDGLTTARRVQLHRRVLRALEARYGDAPGAQLAALVHHAVAGSEFEKARRYASRAGDRSLELLAYEEAERLYQLALDSLDLATPSDDHGRCELLLALGDVQARAGNGPGARETFLQAAAIARTAGMPERLGRAALGYGGRFVWVRAGADKQIIPLLESALAALDDRDSKLRVLLLARLAGALRDELSPERRDSLSAEAVAMARRVGDPETLAYALDGRYAAIWSPDNHEERFAIATELLRLGEELGEGERAFQGHDYRSVVFLERGELSAFDEEVALMASLAEQLRQPAQLWIVLQTRALRALIAGQFDRAEGLIAEALAVGRGAERWDAVLNHNLQMLVLRREQGRLEEMETIVEQSVDEYPSRRMVACALTSLYAELGREAKASSTFEALAASAFTDIPSDNEWRFALSSLAEASAYLGDTRRATTLYTLLRPHADRLVTCSLELSTGPVSRYLGLLASTLTRWDDAVQHFEDALAISERIHAHPWIAHTQDDYARMLLARGSPGDRERAEELLAAALTGYTELGMTSYAARASARPRGTAVETPEEVRADHADSSSASCP
jgi:DNA-binding SARP family transcriptional activator